MPLINCETDFILTWSEYCVSGSKQQEISENSDYTTSNSLDYGYFSKYYKLIAIDLSKQIELENSNLKQQINFVGKLDRATIIFIIEKSEETTFEFSQSSC